MAKRWLAKIHKESIHFMRRTLIGALSFLTVAGLLYLTKPLLWSGGLGIGKSETVTKEIVEKNNKGNLVKKTTKYDDGKTLWDWLSLLGVPLYLALIGLWFQWIQQKRSVELAQEQRERDEKAAKEQREIAANETKEEVLQVYFDRLSVLLVDKNLLAIASKIYAKETQEEEGQPKIEATLEERELLDSAVDISRARTLSVLRRFENDSERKTSVIRFLIEADIVSKLKLSLSGANLSGASLMEADLNKTDLSGADLSETNQIGANLIGAILNRAKLNNAHLIYADLRESELIGADLRGARLSSADLRGANLSRAKLDGAELIAAKLSKANLSQTRFGNNQVLSVDAIADMRTRGAIFENLPESDMPSVLQR